MLALVRIPFRCASMTPGLIAVAGAEVVGVDDQDLHRAGRTGLTASSHSTIPSSRSGSQPESPSAAAATLQTSRLASRAKAAVSKIRFSAPVVGNVPVREPIDGGPVGVEDPRAMRRVEAKQEGGHVEPARSRGGLVPVDEAHAHMVAAPRARSRSSARDRRGAASRAPPTAARRLQPLRLLVREVVHAREQRIPGRDRPVGADRSRASEACSDRVTDVRRVEVPPAIASPEPAFMEQWVLREGRMHARDGLDRRLDLAPRPARAADSGRPGRSS